MDKKPSEAEAKKSFEKKEMDPDDSFQAVELMVPAKELSKDKDLVSKLGPPKWQIYTYINENGKCTPKHHKSENEAKDYFNTELSNDPKSNKVILAQGNIVSTSSSDQHQLQQCIGSAILDGNLKRKSFAHGYYYVVNQTDLGN